MCYNVFSILTPNSPKVERPQIPVTGEWINTLGCIYTMGRAQPWKGRN